MRFRVILQNNPWQIAIFLANIKKDETINIKFLKDYISLWPFERVAVFVWSKIVNILKSRLIELHKEHFSDFIQNKDLNTENREEISVILDFITVLYENTSGRTHLNINEAIMQFIYCIDLDISYKAFSLLKIIMQKQQRSSVIMSDNLRISNLNELFYIKKDSIFMIENEEIDFNAESILSINNRAIKLKIDLNRYSRLFFSYVEFKDENQIINLKYHLVSILITKKPLDATISEKIKANLYFALERLHIEITEFEKNNIFDLLNTAVDRRFKQKLIFDKLRVKIHGGIFISELKNLNLFGGRYIKTFLTFVMSCINVKSDSINFIIELGIMQLLKSILQTRCEKNDIQLINTKIYVSRIFSQILNNQTLPQNIMTIAESLFITLYDEMEIMMNIIPQVDYENLVSSDRVFADKEYFIHRKYLRSLLKFFDDFFTYNAERDRIVDLPDLFDTKLYCILVDILRCYKKYCYKTVNYVINIIIVYINTYPLNIIILDEKGVTPILFRVYEDIPPFSTLIISLIDLINGLCLRSEIFEKINEEKLVEKVMRTILSDRYIDCYKINNTTSYMGNAIEELIRHHPNFHNIVFKECLNLTSTLLNNHTLQFEDKKQVFKDLIEHQKQKKNEIDSKPENHYLEKIKNLMILFDNLFIPESYTEEEIKAIFSSLIDVISQPCVYSDLEEDLSDLFINFSMKNNKMISKYFFHKIVMKNVNKILARFENCDFLRMIEILYSIDLIFAKKDVIKIPSYTTEQLCIILGYNFEPFIQFALDINALNRLLILQKDIGISKMKTTKNVEVIRSIFHLFELFYDLYKLYILNKNEIYLRFIEKYEFSVLRDDLLNSNTTFQKLGTKLGLKIYTLHLTTLSLVKDIWGEVLQLDYSQATYFSQKLFSCIRFEVEEEGFIAARFAHSENKSMDRSLKIASADDYIPKLLKFHSPSILDEIKHRRISERNNNPDRFILMRYIISTFFIVNVLDAVFDNNTTLLLDSTIYEFHTSLLLIINEFKNAYEENLKYRKILTKEFFKPHDNASITVEKQTNQNVFLIDEKQDVYKIYIKSIEVYLRQLSNSLNYSFLIFDSQKEPSIFKIITEMSVIEKNEGIIKQIYNILKWFIIENITIHYNFQEFINQDTDNLSKIETIFLECILKQTDLDKKLLIRDKNFLLYFIKNHGYSLLNELQKRDQHSFYMILENNKMVLSALINKIFPDKQEELASLLCNHLLIYMFLRPCDCVERYGTKIANSMTYLQNVSSEHRLQTYCLGHYDNQLFDLFFKVALFTGNYQSLNLNREIIFLLIFLKLSDNDLFISKKEIYDVINWKRLFTIIGNDMNNIGNILLNSLIFNFFEDENYLRRVFSSIIKNRFNQNFNMNILFYKNKKVYLEVLSNDNATYTCSNELKEEQKELFRFIVRNVFSSPSSNFLIRVISELLVYFPILSKERVLKSFLTKIFDKLIRKEADKLDLKESKSNKWVYNVIAVLMIRTDNFELKRYILDLIIKNIKSGNDQSISVMCILMTNLLSIKVLADKFPCGGTCCSFKKEKPENLSQTRSLTVVNSQPRADRRRHNQSHVDRTNISERDIHGFLDNLANRVNELPERWEDFEREILFENEDTILNTLPTDLFQVFQGDNYCIIEMLTERKIMNILLETAPNENSKIHILTFLDLFCRYKNLKEKSEEDSITFDDDSQNSISTSDSLNSDDISYSEEEDSTDNGDSHNTETVPKKIYKIDACKFIGVQERWTEEYKILMNDIRENYLFPDQNSKLYERPTQEPTPQYVQNAENTNNVNSNDGQIDRASESVLREGLVPEQEVCSFREDCQCFDCAEPESSDSSIGDYNGEYPDLDPVVLNDLPRDILTEVIINFYEERRRISTNYIPINTHFLLELNSEVRDIFEDYELRFREDYQINTETNYEVMDVSEIQIRDKHALIDLKQINNAIELVFSNINEKTGINFIHSLCSNIGIRVEFVKKILNVIRECCLEIRRGNDLETNQSKLNLSIKAIHALIRQHDDYLIYFSLEDINLFYESVDILDYEKNFSFFDEIGTIICDYDLLKKILVNTPGLKIEFTDDIRYISQELFPHRNEIGPEKIHVYLPYSLNNFESRKDVMVMNIIDSNISFIMNKYINLNLWLDIFKNSTNTEILEHYEGIMRGDCFYYTDKYIKFMYEEILFLFEKVDFENDFYDIMNKIYFYFLVLSRIRINLTGDVDTKIESTPKNIDIPSESNNTEFLVDLDIRFSYYYLECDILFTKYRERVENHPFWNYFFDFIKNNSDSGFLLKFIQVFESFCLLRKLRLNESDYLKIINGHEIKDEVNMKGVLNSKIEPMTEHKRHKKTSFNELFRDKIYEYKEVLNILFESYITSADNSLEILLYFNILNFNNKRNYIKHLFVKKSTFQTIYLNIERKNLFEDSFNQIMNKSGEDFAFSRLNVKFTEEEGVDVGGLSREFFNILSKEIVNPNYCLFYLNTDKRTYSINKSSFVNTDHLLFFRFVGRIIAKGIIDNFLADIHFTMPFYKQILGLKLSLSDLESVEPDYYKSYIWMKNNSIYGVLDLRFAVEFDEFGVITTVDLKPNGRNIIVDDENKCEYIDLMSEFHMTKGCEKQIETFKRGFYEVLEEKYVRIFNEKELELLISGLPEIDVDDWRNNTEYYGYRNTSKEIEWFWRCVRNMNNEDRARLLQFVTGTSKLPIDGFKGLQGSDRRQKFQIHAGGKGLPCAHTCFNQLDLPRYSTYEELSECLLYAIRECNTGFGMA